MQGLSAEIIEVGDTGLDLIGLSVVKRSVSDFVQGYTNWNETGAHL